MTQDRIWAHSIYCAYRDGKPCNCKDTEPAENRRYGPGNPDWEHDRAREERDV